MFMRGLVNTGLTCFPLLPKKSLGVQSVPDLHLYTLVLSQELVMFQPLALQAPLQCVSLTS